MNITLIPKPRAIIIQYPIFFRIPIHPALLFSVPVILAAIHLVRKSPIFNTKKDTKSIQCLPRRYDNRAVIAPTIRFILFVNGSIEFIIIASFLNKFRNKVDNFFYFIPWNLYFLLINEIFGGYALSAHATSAFLSQEFHIPNPPDCRE